MGAPFIQMNPYDLLATAHHLQAAHPFSLTFQLYMFFQEPNEISMTLHKHKYTIYSTQHRWENELVF